MRNQTGNSSFSVSRGVSASAHDDGIVILHTGKGHVFSSNKTGALIWRGLEQGHSLEGIVAEVSDQFHIPGPTARLDTVNFLAALEQQALIRREVAS